MKKTPNVFSLTHSYLKNNAKLFLLACLLFASNQLLELVIITLNVKTYSNLCIWDCYWYSSIVSQGYDLGPRIGSKVGAASWAFFPALPRAAIIINFLTHIPIKFSLILVGKLFFLLAIFSFIKFVKAYNPKIPAILAGAVLAFSPYSIYGNVGYTEPLFLFFTCVTFLCMRKNNYIMAGIAGAILSSVRFVGVFILISYFIFSIKEFLLTENRQKIRIILGGLLIPLGLSLFMLFLYYRVGDALAFEHVERAWTRSLESPLSRLIEGYTETGIACLSSFMATIALIFVAMLTRQKRYELAVYSLFCTIIPLSTGLWSMPRYLWWQAPLLLVLIEFIHKRKIWFLALPLAMAGLIYMYHGWFSGKGFVI